MVDKVDIVVEHNQVVEDMMAVVEVHIEEDMMVVEKDFVEVHTVEDMMMVEIDFVEAHTVEDMMMVEIDFEEAHNVEDMLGVNENIFSARYNIFYNLSLIGLIYETVFRFITTCVGPRHRTP